MNFSDSSSLDYFNQKGYVIIKKQVNDQLLKKLRDCSKNIINKATIIKWPFTRVYRDYPYFFGKPNIFGIDYPLNIQLGDKLLDLLNELKIKNVIKKIGSFNDFETELIRLHTNSHFFNYQGGWHRDHDIYPSSGYLQCVLYLESEKGFRIVPKDKNNLLIDYGIDNRYQSNLSVNDSFIKLPDKIIDTVSAEAGDLLFFEPGLLHQGFCKKYRLHYIIRFKKIEFELSDPKNIFNFVKNLLPNSNLEGKNQTYNYKMNFFSNIKRIKTLILYFFPRIKMIWANILSKKKLSIFHSTIWQ